MLFVQKIKRRDNWEEAIATIKVQLKKLAKEDMARGNEIFLNCDFRVYLCNFTASGEEESTVWVI